MFHLLLRRSRYNAETLFYICAIIPISYKILQIRHILFVFHCLPLSYAVDAPEATIAAC